jgi:hypothetical protein
VYPDGTVLSFEETCCPSRIVQFDGGTIDAGEVGALLADCAAVAAASLVDAGSPCPLLGCAAGELKCILAGTPWTVKSFTPRLGGGFVEIVSTTAPQGDAIRTFVDGYAVQPMP